MVNCELHYYYEGGAVKRILVHSYYKNVQFLRTQTHYFIGFVQQNSRRNLNFATCNQKCRMLQVKIGLSPMCLYDAKSCSEACATNYEGSSTYNCLRNQQNKI